MKCQYLCKIFSKIVTMILIRPKGCINFVTVNVFLFYVIENMVLIPIWLLTCHERYT